MKQALREMSPQKAPLNSVFRDSVLERTGKRNTHPRELDKLLLRY